MSAVCECCGTALTETDRIDFGFRLPDAVLDRPESDLTRLRKDLLHADEVWNDPSYAEFTTTGRLANLVRPWGEDILGAELLVDVRDVDELPVARSSSQEHLTGLLEDAPATEDRITEITP